MSWLLMLCSWFANFASLPMPVASEDVRVDDPHTCHDFLICPQMRMRNVTSDEPSWFPKLFFDAPARDDPSWHQPANQTIFPGNCTEIRLTVEPANNTMQLGGGCPFFTIPFADATQYDEFPNDGRGQFVRQRLHKSPSAFVSNTVDVLANCSHLPILGLHLFQFWGWLLRVLGRLAPWVFGQKIVTILSSIAVLGQQACRNVLLCLGLCKEKQIILPARFVKRMRKSKIRRRKAVTLRGLQWAFAKGRITIACPAGLSMP